MSDSKPVGTLRVDALSFGRLWPLACLGAAVLLVPQVYLWDHTCDDAYISFRYVLQAMAGHGLVFNPGEYVEGFSHPFFVILLLALGLTGFDTIVSAKVIGLLCTVATGGLLLDVLRREVSCLWGVCTGLGLWLVAPGLHLYLSAGLETPLLGVLLMLAIWRESTDRGALWTGVVLGLAALTRPEAVLAGPIWLAWRYVARSRGGVVTGLLGWVCLPLAWQVFRVTYYGDWLPNPFHAKPPGTFGGYFGIPYIGPFVVASCPPLVLLGLLRFTENRVGVGRWWLGWLALGMAAPGYLLAVYARGDWMPFGRFLVPGWCAVSLLAARGISELGLRGWQRGLAGTALIVSAGLALTPKVPAYLRGDDLDEIMRGHRQVAAGVWLADRMNPGETVATIRLGGLGFALLDYRVLDLAGLTNRDAAMHLGRHGGTLTWETHPMRQLEPDWLAVVASRDDVNGPHNDEVLASDLERHYVLEGRLAQGAVQEWQFWRRLR